MFFSKRKFCLCQFEHVFSFVGKVVNIPLAMWDLVGGSYFLRKGNNVKTVSEHYIQTTISVSSLDSLYLTHRQILLLLHLRFRGSITYCKEGCCYSRTINAGKEVLHWRFVVPPFLNCTNTFDCNVLPIEKKWTWALNV